PLAQIGIGKMRRRVGADAGGRFAAAEWRRHAVRLRLLLGHVQSLDGSIRKRFTPTFAGRDYTGVTSAQAKVRPRLRIGAPPSPRLCCTANTYIAKQFSARRPMQTDSGPSLGPSMLREWID